MSGDRLPYAEIEAVFLDVGNTLLTMDFSWVAAELAVRGVACEEGDLRRAEAAARPPVSRYLAERDGTESDAAFLVYLRAILERLPTTAPWLEARRAQLVDELAPALREPGRADRLWSSLLPGVPEALSALREAGLTLAVVSNADGSVERSLARLGLRPLLDAVCDSHVVGWEKPDPRIFQHALERCGVDPARTVHVGDLYHFDVLGARSAGLHAVLLDPWDDWSGVDCVRHRDLAALTETILAARDGQTVAAPRLDPR